MITLKEIYLQGDIFVSVERVRENANDFNVAFEDEIKRVLSHGILHYCGYKDKSPEDELLMRSKEDEKIQECFTWNNRSQN